MNARTPLAVLTAALVAAALGFAGEAAARALLTTASWSASGLPADSTVSEDGGTLTTRLPAAPPATDLKAKGILTFDTKYGTDAPLSFLSDHPWVSCEAPGGLTTSADGTIPIECTARGSELGRVEAETRVYLKVDPPGGGEHRKLYWVFVPGP